jgi:hypothetical protein
MGGRLMDVTVGGLPLTGVDSFGVRWILDRNGVKGWGAPSGTLAPRQRPRAAGAWGGLSYAKPRPLVMSGTCVAPTEALAGDAENRLLDACSLDDSVLTVTRAGVSRHATVRRDGEISPVWVNPFSFDWSVQFVALDPRKMYTPVTSITSLPSTSGGTSFPMSFPMSFTATTVSGQVSIFNQGNEVGPVTARLTGPLTGPTITHVGSGLRLVFAASATIGAGEYWDIDFEAQTVLAQGQSSRAVWITSRQWFGLEPGNNTFALSAASYTTGTLSVTGTPCDK